MSAGKATAEIQGRAEKLAREILLYNGSYYTTSSTAEEVIAEKLARALTEERARAFRDAAEYLEYEAKKYARSAKRCDETGNRVGWSYDTASDQALRRVAAALRKEGDAKCDE